MHDRLQHLSKQGYIAIPSILNSHDLIRLKAKVSQLDEGRAGSRDVLKHTWCQQLAQQLRSHPSIAPLLVNCPTAVQCTYFDKSPSRNWLVPLHQDLSIPVKARVNTRECTGWSFKEGTWYCQPPDVILTQLLALRLHLDDNHDRNGPLRLIPASHTQGRLAQTDIVWLVNNVDEVRCTLHAGGVLAMRPLTLHASSKSTSSTPRRVLHYVFGPAQLPFGLEWKTAL